MDMVKAASGVRISETVSNSRTRSQYRFEKTVVEGEKRQSEEKLGTFVNLLRRVGDYQSVQHLTFAAPALKLKLRIPLRLRSSASGCRRPAPPLTP
eukprot:1188779-Prorocentrum_minimum.AAC.3